MKSECHGCEERHHGCHAECEKYKKFRKERDEQIKRRYEQTRLDYLLKGNRK